MQRKQAAQKRAAKQQDKVQEQAGRIDALEVKADALKERERFGALREERQPLRSLPVVVQRWSGTWLGAEAGGRSLPREGVAQRPAGGGWRR